VRAIPPESPAARDEGPRLIPLPERDPHQTPGVPHHPADGYVGIANEAIRIWKNEPQSNKKPQDGKQ
jgi:hypothetical protein